jgi:UDP-glucose 4-epimerase
MKRICVVGGSGFLGSYVADALTRLKNEVVIYDIVESPWRSKDQKMVLGDINDLNKLKHTLEGVNVVYNFAAFADLNMAINNPLETVKANILGNVNVLEACLANGVERFMYGSTVYVHSREGGFYRCSKQAAEGYVTEYFKTYGIPYTILRYGSLYGPRSGPDNGLYKIVKKAIETKRLSYQGNSNSLREYIHVEDAASASVDALDPSFINQSVVLTGQEPMRVEELLKLLGEILDINSPIEFLDEKQSGHYVRTPYSYESNIGKKYIPSLHVDLGQGLLQLIEEIHKMKTSAT